METAGSNKGGPLPQEKHIPTRPHILRFLGLSLFLVFMLVATVPLWGAPEEAGPQTLDGAGPIQLSIENALASHNDDLEYLRGRLEKLASVKVAFQKENQAYEAENTAHSQLLLASNPRIEVLESALNNNRRAAKALTEQMGRLQALYEAAADKFSESTERIDLARKQIADIQQASLSGTQKRRLKETTRELIQALQEKKGLGQQIEKQYDTLKGELQRTLDEKNALGEKLAANLGNRLKQSLFTPAGFYHKLSGEALREAFASLGSRVAGLLAPQTWQAQWAQIKRGGILRWTIFAFWLALIGLLQARGRAYLQGLQEKLVRSDGTYRTLLLNMLWRSLPYLGLALLFGLYSSLKLPLLDIGLSRVLFNLFLTLLLIRWGVDYLKFSHRQSPTALWQFISRRLKRLLRILRVVIIIAILFVWAAGKSGLLTWLMRDLMALVLLVWTARFWHQIRRVIAEAASQGQAAPHPIWLARVRGLSFLVTGGGLLISVAGYSMLAGHWYVAWIRTGTLLFWGWLSMKAIGEWRLAHQSRGTAAEKSQAATSTHHLHGAVIQIIWVVWFLGLTRGFIWAWDSSGMLMARLLTVSELTLTIGKLKFSISELVQAAVILFCTHLAVRLGRALLREKVLDKKAYERGFKDSILTISSYLAWGLGLILALTTIGVNATSLAVVFGALSVGIGFGLQNIFNNFISGLILLFERPIQVGDIVEVGGIWAEVRKINVRATVVQTFDNASVIIPNSEFISQQVTNWSFKDKRMRRNIEVGVAYGSDIDLVQQTLLEIVGKDRDIYKSPRPEVLFVDHAASALIFRVRIWLHVDNYWSVPSRIRYEIDRRFRELDIEIAFPQQDVHIRTLPTEIHGAADQRDTE